MNDEIQIKIDVLQNFYKENADNYRYFTDWRHKVMLRYVFAFATSILFLKVILDYKGLVPMFLWLSPSLIISISSLIALGMDRRNGILIEQVKTIGKELEIELLALAGFDNERAKKGAFYMYRIKEETTFTYSTILNKLYKSTSLFFFSIYIIGTIMLYCTKGIT